MGKKSSRQSGGLRSVCYAVVRSSKPIEMTRGTHSGSEANVTMGHPSHTCICRGHPTTPCLVVHPVFVNQPLDRHFTLWNSHLDAA